MATYVNENFSGRDFSNGLADVTFVDCDMTGVKLPTRWERFTDVHFVNCKFDLIINKDLHGYIRPLYEANYRFTADYVPYVMFSDVDTVSYFYGHVSFHSDGLRQPIDPGTICSWANDESRCYRGFKILRLDKDGRFLKYVLAELMIPVDTPSVLFRDCKCRAERATVWSIRDFYNIPYTKAYSAYHSPHITYEVGKEVVADKWDPDPMKECGHGIHFFLTVTEAWKYYLSFQ